MRQLITGVLLLLASCHDNRPPAPTAEQSSQLDDSERMLNDMAKNQEGPEQSPGPSKKSN